MDIKEFVKNIEEEIISIRRHIHKYPELSEKEYNTQQYIIDFLSKNKIEYYKCADTGVVASVFGLKKEGLNNVVGLRADIDALSMNEISDKEYKSTIVGVAHTCGHDAHTAIALGVIAFFSANKSEFNGCLKVFFQPAEETIGGADRMVKQGCMENPKVDYVIGKHVMAHHDVGIIEVKYDKLNASSDEVHISIKGKSAHASRPDEGNDALSAACAVITNLNVMISRSVSPLNQVVLSFGTINGGSKNNIICDDVKIHGTLRTTDQETREFLFNKITNTIKNTSSIYGCNGEVEFGTGYKALINDNDMVDVIKDVAIKVYGKDSVVFKKEPSMGAEDFSYFLDKAKGAFYSLGAGNKTKGIINNIHSSDFDIDEDCIKIGIELDINIILELLEKCNK